MPCKTPRSLRQPRTMKAANQRPCDPEALYKDTELTKQNPVERARLASRQNPPFCFSIVSHYCAYVQRCWIGVLCSSLTVLRSSSTKEVCMRVKHQHKYNVLWCSPVICCVNNSPQLSKCLWRPDVQRAPAEVCSTAFLLDATHSGKYQDVIRVNGK